MKLQEAQRSVSFLRKHLYTIEDLNLVKTTDLSSRYFCFQKY